MHVFYLRWDSIFFKVSDLQRVIQGKGKKMYENDCQTLAADVAKYAPLLDSMKNEKDEETIARPQNVKF